MMRRHMRVINDETKSCSDAGIKVAFASIGLKEVNQHFGLAKGFAVYQISVSGYKMLEAVGFDESKTYEPGHSEDKLTDKINLVKDCVAVYSNAVGPRAVSRLLEKGVHPIKVDEGILIAELVDELYHRVKSNDIPSWMRRATNAKSRAEDDPGRFDKMFEQEWAEV